ncbi:hypothetical protein GE061_011467 [Apolygus lucorum]|uniref:Uncharacterized protein n=1 Tax=Apolygus lucorum TaxID=248454 RepID=A0A6A4K8M7_APOLU|nr:hypothetical protein GE061_011467 [Apolygus lucorum]
MKPIIVMGNQNAKRMAKKKKRYKGSCIALTPVEAAERLCRLIAIIDKVGDNMAAEAERIEDHDLDKINVEIGEQMASLEVEYERKLAMLVRELNIFQSKKRRESHLALFAHQNRLYTGVVDEAKMRLGKDIGSGDNRFPKRQLINILEDLVVQSLHRLNEPKFILYLRKRDFKFANNIIGNSELRVGKMSGRRIEGELDSKRDLEGDDVRIVVSNVERNIYVENNLFDKVERVANDVLVAYGPGQLFGQDD